jgi:colanic acid/amylovoran biosynthesis protein
MPEPGSNTHFLLIGNNVYLNRGCEAIVRGTMEILRAEFGEGVTADNGCFGDPELCYRQAAEEGDQGIRRTYPLAEPRKGFERWVRSVNHRTFLHLPKSMAIRLPGSYGVTAESLRTANAALEIGGDNYSLDYGFPVAFVELDRYIQSRRVPVVLWGASVGPFDSRPSLARKLFDHLRSLSAILVRETITEEYLYANGVRENVHLVGDPAFLMAPQQPPPSKLPFEIAPTAIGLNLSPLFGRYVCGSKTAQWLSMCVEFVDVLSRKTGRQIVLVPHVTSSRPETDDHVLLSRIARLAGEKGVSQVFLAGRDLNAAETKWVIGRCAVFAGARTHATIAAFSLRVPTLSFSYSIKAKGLTRLVWFG